MPGELPLPVSTFPDVLQYISVNLGQNGSGVVAADQPIFHCERDTVVDAAFIRCATADGDATITLKHFTTGNVTDGTAFSSAAALSATAGTVIPVTITDTANVIPAGDAIGVDVGGTSTAVGVNVTLRIRTKRK
jgi:hypothetical protein